MTGKFSDIGFDAGMTRYTRRWKKKSVKIETNALVSTKTLRELKFSFQDSAGRYTAV